ncbi:hypothetical protein ACU6VG_06050 [Sphaerotilus sulfidivorans]|jgi:hypothetical protein|uniref:hypothetical protein n=1 Tax=Sphaerotilus sp. FB-3 TaxID=2913396 RepID=UPI00203F6CD5|nr:hypothetical protein [Sphaerotilus sp. FB-3]GKQ58447.1 hypothetical protein QMTAC487_23070 [Sphaerotilus sp. FB-3]
MIKFQGSVKGMVLVAAAVLASTASLAAHAQARVVTARATVTAALPAVVSSRGTPAVGRPGSRPTPPAPVVVQPPCKRGGPGITPC